MWYRGKFSLKSLKSYLSFWQSGSVLKIPHFPCSPSLPMPLLLSKALCSPHLGMSLCTVPRSFLWISVFFSWLCFAAAPPFLAPHHYLKKSLRKKKGPLPQWTDFLFLFWVKAMRSWPKHPCANLSSSLLLSERCKISWNGRTKENTNGLLVLLEWEWNRFLCHKESPL